MERGERVTTPHGFKDWGRYVSESDVLYTRAQDVVIAAAGQRVLGPFNTFGSRGLFIEARSLSNSARIVVTWVADSAGTQDITSDGFVVRALGRASVSLPVRSAFAFVSVIAPTAVGTEVLITVATDRAPGIPVIDSNDNTLLSVAGILVGAGATSNNDIGVTWPGEAQWCVVTDLASWRADLQRVDVNGAFVTFYTLRPTPNTQGPRVILPMSPIRARLLNNTGAGGTYDMFLSGYPLTTVL